MNDEHRLGPAPRRLLVLVRPAAIVGERLAGEKLRIVRRRLVGEDDDDLALDIDALVIVPVELRCRDAVAEKQGVGVEIFRLLRHGLADKFVLKLERNLSRHP